MKLSRGIVIGTMWGLVNPFLYGFAVWLKFPINIVGLIISLPAAISVKIEYLGFLYYFGLSMFIGAIIGFGIEKIYKKTSFCSKH